MNDYKIWLEEEIESLVKKIEVARSIELNGSLIRTKIIIDLKGRLNGFEQCLKKLNDVEMI